MRVYPKIISEVRGRGGGLLDRWPSALGGRRGRRARRVQALRLAPAQQFPAGAVAAQWAVLDPQLEQEPYAGPTSGPGGQGVELVASSMCRSLCTLGPLARRGCMSPRGGRRLGPVPDPAQETEGALA